MFVAILLAHGYLWWRLVRSTTRPGGGRRRLTWVIVALASLVTVFNLVVGVPQRLGARRTRDSPANGPDGPGPAPLPRSPVGR